MKLSCSHVTERWLARLSTVILTDAKWKAVLVGASASNGLMVTTPIPVPVAAGASTKKRYKLFEKKENLL